ncbi:TonB-dependent siderophore receptor [Rhodopseudomonas sp. WA056]|nr:TonB-dependent siderophore receptor [Rhodopseudomonas sp. WA056]
MTTQRRSAELHNSRQLAIRRGSRLAASLPMSALLLVGAVIEDARAQATTPTPAVPTASALPPVVVSAPKRSKPKRAAARPAAIAAPVAPPRQTSRPSTARVADGPGYVARASTTGTKTNTPLIETPQSVSVINRQQMDAQNVQSVTDALRYSAGVVATTPAISQRFDTFSIRGFDASSTGILRDGLRGTTAQAWPKTEPYGLERVEILRGPSSVLYGQNTPGGLVNLITKRPLDTPVNEVMLQGGSFDRLQGQFDLSGPIDKDGQFLYRLTGLARDSNTQFKAIPDDKLFIAPAFTWRPDIDTTLTILTDYSYEKFGPPRPYIPIQGTLLPNKNGQLPRNQFLDQPGLANDRTQYSAGYLFERHLDDTFTMRSNFRYGHVDLLTNTASGMNLAADQRTLNRALYQFRIVGDTYASDNQIQADWWMGSTQFVSLAGVDYRRSTEDYYLNSGRAPSIDIFNPVYDQPIGVAATPNASTWQTSDQVGIYGQQQIKFDGRWVLSLGGRQDWSNTATDNRLKSSTATQDDKAFTYRAGLVYLSDVGLAPYIGYSTSFSPLLGTDFYGQPYKPTTGRQAEIGVKYQPAGATSFVTMSVFDLYQENVQTTDPNNSLNRLQVGEVRSRGFELQGVANPIAGLNLVASYTHTDLTVTKSNNLVELGNRPTGLPADTASLWGDYTFQSGALTGFGAGFGTRYVGETFADAANTIGVPSYVLFDAALHYDLGQLHRDLKGMRLAINATNLTNKQYYVSCSTTSCNAGFDRSVIASLRYRW